MHRITTVLLLVLTIVSLIATGCGKSVPKGSSTEVKAIVLQIADGYYLDQLAGACYQQVSGIPIALVGMKVDYAWLRDNADTDGSAMKALKALDGVKAKMNLSLQNVRTEEVDKEIGRTRYSCEIVFGKNIDKVSFTAQCNEAGRLYVEVFGLGDD